MKNKSTVIEEESFFPSITDLMVGIIFIFIIIVMSLILQIKEEQDIIPKPLFDKISQLSEIEKSELDVMINQRDDFDQTIKDLAIEKNNNKKLNEELSKANEVIERQININNEGKNELDDILTNLTNEIVKNIDLTNQINKYELLIEEQIKKIDNAIIIDLKNNLLQDKIDKITSELSTSVENINLKNKKLKNKNLLEKDLKNLKNKSKEQDLQLKKLKSEKDNQDKELKLLKNENKKIPDLNNIIDSLKQEVINYKKVINSNDDILLQLNNQSIIIKDLKNQNIILENKIFNYDQLKITENKLVKENLILGKNLLNLKNQLNILENTKTKENDRAELIVAQIEKIKEDTVKILLNELNTIFNKKNIKITIDYPNSKFILKSDKLFSSASPTLLPEGIIQINKIADTFAKVLPCFSYEPFYLKQSKTFNDTKKQWAKIQKKLNHSVYCSSNEMKISQYFKINTVMIEGHTDQNNNKIADEAELSAKRATNTFKQIRDKQLLISGLTNVNGDPIFGYAGYGRSRPLIKNAKSIIQRAKNRRLEFRFLFDSPKKNIITKILEDL